MISEIRQALRQEIESEALFNEFIVRASESDGPLWKIYIDPIASRDRLDESFESAGASWENPFSVAEVLGTDPDADLIVLREATGRPPMRDAAIRIYPPRFMAPLEQIWSDQEWAERCESWLEKALAKDRAPTPLATKYFPKLRAAQKQAFALPGYRAAFLWGPPGTGKTTTLGALMATWLLANPTARALLISTTNSAVDSALLSIDRALDQIGQDGLKARRQCVRLGTNFIAANYVTRAHLIPRGNDSLLANLSRLEASRPPATRAREFQKWRAEIGDLRQQLAIETETALANANLVAFTASRAAYSFEALRERAPFDLIVFDEASQINIPFALALAPLAKSTLFAGDPQQLAPVVRSRAKEARAWIGQSMFKWAGEMKSCFLDEQYRMAAPICDLVSGSFYDGKLRVASDAKTNPAWLRDRSCEGAPARWKKPIIVQEVFKKPTRSKRYGGNIRQQSAFFTAQIILQLLIHTPANEILVLTPFRAQRNLIRKYLRDREISGIDVNTVHRAQGSERNTVIFDPVDAGSRFLQDENGYRLINVAMSRAQARLILLISEDDRGHPVFHKVDYSAAIR
jgi:DNA replication ATP-dependent helicase Dna2